MAAQTRPYFLTFNGEDHIIEASNPAAAVRHVVGAAVTELRVARGNEVTAWHRAGKPIPMVGEKPASPLLTDEELRAGTAPVEEDDSYTADDALAWMVENRASAKAVALFGTMRAQDRMTLEQFDDMQLEMSAFGEVMATAIGGDAPDGGALIDDVRSYLEDRTIDFNVIVGAIGEQKRRELYVELSAPEQPAAE